MELNEYLSESRKRRQKRVRTIRLVIAVFILILIIVGCVWLAVKSPLVLMDRVVVQGNNAVPTGDLVAFADEVFARHYGLFGFLGIHNMLAWPTTVDLGDLALDPRLESATLAKSYLSHVVTLAVTERQPVAVWCFMPSFAVAASEGESAVPPSNASGSAETSTASAGAAPDPSVAVIESESCYWFDGTGVIFEKAFDAEGNLLLAVHDYSQKDPGTGQAILPARFVPDLISILSVLQASGLRLKEVQLNNIGLEEIDATTYNGPTIYFSLRFPAGDTLSVLRSLILKPNFATLQYVDFRTQDRAYYQ